MGNANYYNTIYIFTTSNSSTIGTYTQEQIMTHHALGTDFSGVLGNRLPPCVLKQLDVAQQNWTEGTFIGILISTHWH